MDHKHIFEENLLFIFIFYGRLGYVKVRKAKQGYYTLELKIGDNKTSFILKNKKERGFSGQKSK